MDPLIKLEPIMKLIGNSIELVCKKLTLLLFELFCIPSIKIRNKQELNVKAKNNFLKESVILINFIHNKILVQTINHAFFYSIFFS